MARSNHTILKPRLTLYFSIFISVLFSYLHLFNIPLIYILAGVILSLCLIKIYFFPVIKKDAVVNLWVFFITFSLIPFFYAINLDHAISGLRVYLTMFLIYSIYLFFPLNKKQIHFIMALYITILSYFVLVSLYNVIQSPDLLNHRAFIGTGWIRSNALASLWATSAPISIAFVINSKKMLNKIYFVLITILLIFGVVLVTSRGGLLSLIVGLIIFFGYYFYKKKDNFKRIVVIYIAVALLLISAPILLQSSLFLNLLDRTSIALSGDSNGRFILWQAALDAWKNNIFFGNGFYNLNEYMNRAEEMRAHNFILNMLVDTGIVGAVLYVAMLITLLKRFFNNKKISNDIILVSVLVSLIVTIIHGLFEPTLTVLILGVIFWLKAGMLSSIK